MNMMTSTDNFDAGVTHVTAENFNSLVKNYPWRVRQALGFALMLERGALEVHLPDGCKFRFAGSEDGPEALMIIHDLDFARRLEQRRRRGIAEHHLEIPSAACTRASTCSSVPSASTRTMLAPCDAYQSMTGDVWS